MSDEVTKEEIDYYPEEWGDFTKAFVESLQLGLDDSINKMTKDIMSLKSVSMGEAHIIATRFLLNGITPKSNEFYEKLDKIKTLW